MTRTQHLGLCRWTADDAVSVAEINENFTILDEGVPESRTTLMEVTTAAQSAAVELDLSSLDLTPYRRLRLEMSVFGLQSSSNYTLAKLYLNGDTATARFSMSSYGTSWTSATASFASVTPNSNYGSLAASEFFVHGGRLCISTRREFDYDSDFWKPDTAFTSTYTALSAIRKISLIATSAGYYIAAGAKFKILGVK